MWTGHCGASSMNANGPAAPERGDPATRTANPFPRMETGRTSTAAGITLYASPPFPVSCPPMETRLLQILVCPVCKNTLRHDRERQELICAADRLAYPIRDGVPILLPSDAPSLDAAPAASASSPSPRPAPPPPPS